MLSTETRLRLEEIASKIEKGETVTLEESIWDENGVRPINLHMKS